jgi:hypothetical protein
MKIQYMLLVSAFANQTHTGIWFKEGIVPNFLICFDLFYSVLILFLFHVIGVVASERKLCVQTPLPFL